MFLIAVSHTVAYFQKQGSLIVKIMNTFTLWWTSLHDGSIWKSFFDYLLNTVPFQFSAKVVWNMQFVDNQNVHSSAAHSARCLQSSSRIENVRELPFQQFFTEKLPRAIIFHAWKVLDCGAAIGVVTYVRIFFTLNTSNCITRPTSQIWHSNNSNGMIWQW